MSRHISHNPDLSEPEPGGVGRWFLRLLLWDGAISAVVLAVPPFLRWMAQGNLKQFDIASAFLFIIAMIIRLFVGMNRIGENSMHPFVRLLQSIALFCSLLVLLLMELMLLEAGFRNPGDVLGFVVTALIYFTLIAFALHPGRGPQHDLTLPASHRTFKPRRERRVSMEERNWYQDE